MLPADCLNLLHIRHMPIEMYHHDSLCSLSDLLFYPVCINLIKGIRFYKHRCCSIYGNSHDACYVSISLNNDFITRADPQQSDRHPERIQTACKSDTIFCPGICGKILLKGSDLISENIPARAQD